MTHANMGDVEHLLFESDVSIYQISKGTGIGETTLHKYRRGQANITNITFNNAIKLQKYYDQLQGDGKMGIRSREENFASALAYLNAVSVRRFEKDKPIIEHTHLASYDKQPMTIYARAIKDVMQYADHFEDMDTKLLDQVHDFIDDLGTERFNDDRLAETYLTHYAKKRKEIEEELEYEEFMLEFLEE